MVELKCKNCGGQLVSADNDVFVGDGTAIVRQGATLACEHCSARYLPGEELALSVNIDVEVHQRIDSVESGATVVGVQITLDKSD